MREQARSAPSHAVAAAVTAHKTLANVGLLKFGIRALMRRAYATGNKARDEQFDKDGRARFETTGCEATRARSQTQAKRRTTRHEGRVRRHGSGPQRCLQKKIHVAVSARGPSAPCVLLQCARVQKGTTYLRGLAFFGVASRIRLVPPHVAHTTNECACVGAAGSMSHLGLCIGCETNELEA